LLTNDFQTSALCKADSPQCVAVRRDDAGDVIVKDTKTSRTLTFHPGEWTTFLDGARAGQFDV
jgi:hypothetical protein